MMPAMAVPWPFGSVVPSEPSRIETPATSWPARSGCEASTPVSRTATIALPAGADGAEGLVPADQRQRPLVRVLGVGRGRARVAGRVCVDAHDARVGEERRDGRGGGGRRDADRLEAEDGDRVPRRCAGGREGGGLLTRRWSRR